MWILTRHCSFTALDSADVPVHMWECRLKWGCWSACSGVLAGVCLCVCVCVCVYVRTRANLERALTQGPATLSISGTSCLLYVCVHVLLWHFLPSICAAISGTHCLLYVLLSVALSALCMCYCGGCLCLSGALQCRCKLGCCEVRLQCRCKLGCCEVRLQCTDASSVAVRSDFSADASSVAVRSDFSADASSVA